MARQGESGHQQLQLQQQHVWELNVSQMAARHCCGMRRPAVSGWSLSSTCAVRCVQTKIVIGG